ncbi:MAG: 2-oxo acid dehydrogenase subunit E2 [Candidatus Hydrogenedentes bacterium]|nr:2-oxo acid dehydrogenase subunit E2 [Candidatus Hydrogenedentota bacterium]
MTQFELRVPQLGEGLQEARIVRFLKAPGDAVRRDEPVYEMETDKAVTEVESPCEGTLDSWAVEVDAIVAIGEVVGRIATEFAPAVAEPDTHGRAEGPAAPHAHAAVADHSSTRNVIPPRTRAYATRQGIHENELLSIPASGKRLLPADIDRYLESRSRSAQSAGDSEFDDVAMSARQRTLFYRLTRAQAQVVPGTIEVEVAWEPIKKAHRLFKNKATTHDPVPSRSLLVAWCIVQAMAQHAKFRSVVMDVNTVRRYRHANIGIAVALPDDELTTAVVAQADRLTFEEFIHQARTQIAKAREGDDQASETVIHVAFSSMEAFGVFTAVPVVVSPSVATIFLGAPHDVVEAGPDDALATKRVTHMTMTFDHRVINGVAAANFMLEVRRRVESLPDLCSNGDRSLV